MGVRGTPRRHSAGGGSAEVLTTVDDIRAAARRIEGRVLRTPLRRSPWLSELTGGEILLKLETLQPTHSYKIRGATNAIRRLVEASAGSLPRLVTASAGNHGRALAHAAGEAGLPLTVYVPAGAPEIKREAIRRAGADLRLTADYDEAERQAKAHAASGDALYISPYSHPDIIAGAGTIGLEIVEACPSVDTIVVAIGGGGLISGIAIAAESAAVVGVEVAASCPFTRSLAAGRIVTIDVGETLADGLSGNLDPDTVTFEIVRQRVARIAVVDEPRLAAAVAGIVRYERLIAEGAGAAAVAAVMSGLVETAGRTVAVVLSGANIDRDRLIASLKFEG